MSDIECKWLTTFERWCFRKVKKQGKKKQKKVICDGEKSKIPVTDILEGIDERKKGNEIFELYDPNRRFIKLTVK